FSYCFSFEQKTKWSRKWAPQEEIRDYMDHCARKYDVLHHIRFGSEVAGARWDDDAAAWRIRTASGAETTADVLVSAVGQLNRPAIPPIPGLERFRGERFHSARWNHAYDLAGKRVAVIGNAASAIQFIPQIAPRVAHLTIFQRTANWLQPLGRSNVEVVTDGIDHVREDAVVGRDGRVHAVDAIILATGFESTAFLAPMAIEGAAGRRLDAAWADGARAYRGITVAGFPNFFMMYGPNTNLGHNSIIFMLECQTR